MFLPNQRVVCVDGKFPLGIEALYTALPKEGNTYTIRDIVPGCNYKGEAGEVAVYLVELVNPCNKVGVERGFNAERFAPLQEDTEVLEHEFAMAEPALV